MEKKTLFEIPIYSMSEKEFNKRWNKKKTEFYDMLVSHGHSDEDARYYTSASSFPRCLWKYNQIVGYIMSGDPTYITSYNGARSLVMKVERDELVEELLKAYIEHNSWE